MTFNEFEAMSLDEKQTAVELCKFPPPDGSVSFFGRVCVVFCPCVLVLLMIGCSHRQKTKTLTRQCLQKIDRKQAQAANFSRNRHQVPDQPQRLGPLTEKRRKKKLPLQLHMNSVVELRSRSLLFGSFYALFSSSFCHFQRATVQKAGSYDDEVILCSFFLVFV